MRIEDQLGKGYLWEEFEEVFKRYMPKAELEEFKRSQGK
jgi:hypothetical protein